MDAAKRRIECINEKHKQNLAKLSQSYEKEWDELMDAQISECERLEEMYIRRDISWIGYRRERRRLGKKHDAELITINKKYNDAHEIICLQHAKEVNEARREDIQKRIKQLEGPL